MKKTSVSKIMVRLLSATIVLLLVFLVLSLLPRIEYIRLQIVYNEVSRKNRNYEERSPQPEPDYERDLLAFEAVAKTYEQAFANISERISQMTVGIGHDEASTTWMDYVIGSDDELNDAFHEIFERLDLQIEFEPDMNATYYQYDGHLERTFDFQYAILYILNKEETDNLVQALQDGGGYKEINDRLYAFYYVSE